LELGAKVEGNPDSDQTLRFVSGQSGFGAAVLAAIIAIGAITTIADGNLGTVATPGGAAGTVVALIFFACILFQVVTRQWIAEIDLAARRLKISRQFLGHWKKTVVACPFEEICGLGTIEYNNDGHASYGVYMQLKDGTQHAVPLSNSTFGEAARVASELSVAIGIPRVDTVL
jgi:hypothetical protein